MSNKQLNALYVIGLVVGAVVRGIYTKRYRNKDYKEERHTSLLEWSLMLLWGVSSQVIPIVYMRSKCLKAADYCLPKKTSRWTGIAGACAYTAGIWLLWRSHADLGRSWTPTLAIREKHELVTDGVYRYMRHPMYAAHLLWGIAQALLLQNWIAGFAGLATLVPVYLMRVDREEQMMLEYFGDDYAQYMNRTGRLFPRLPVRSIGLGG
ncbi:MAG: protein-S-isoprenylcysteine O-methyltransferase [Chloroflexi bacterium]|nr:protein-S-isoprenylcysteine O-methyltransferase [Chloroflexota bacterium]MDA1228350.1 protein-S-isoprenylcysteine O-methyltransferase [Chloroflexota bacterium]